MTSTFIGRVGKMLKAVLYLDNTTIIDKSTENIGKRALIGLGLAGLHATYVFTTSSNEEIKVVKKYKMDRNGFTNFMVVDDKNRHFNVNNSIWYWKWDSIEDWAKIEERYSLSVKYYGMRIPMLGLFPNIVTSSYNPTNTEVIAQRMNDYTPLKRALIDIHNEKMKYPSIATNIV